MQTSALRPVLFVSLLLLCSSVPAVGQSASPSESVPSAQAVSRLTNDDLPKLLRGLGYEVEKTGDSTYRFTLERGKWKFKINVSISSNGRKFWMSSFLAQIPDLNSVPASALTKLMLANSDIGPAHFYICNCETCRAQKEKWLKMGFALDNRDLTPSYIREELEWFAQRLEETAPLWDTSKWAAATTGRIRVAMAPRSH